MDIDRNESINIYEICRSCLLEKNLTVTPQSDDWYTTFITSCGINPEEFDGIPLIVCESCARKMQEFNEFRDKCLESHNTLAALLKSRSVNSETKTIDSADCHLEIIEIRSDFLEADNSLCGVLDYCCAVCGALFDNSKLLHSHVKLHDSSCVKKFTCARCNKSYTNVNNLKFHLDYHLGVKPFKCKFCQRKFTKQSTLKVHLLNHRGSKDFLCSECGKSFTTGTALNRHKTFHKGIRPYQCSFCPKTFSSSSDRTVHLRTHTGEKPFLCSICGKQFRRGTHLNVHRRTHTGEKPYRCSICGKCFTQSGDLRSHCRLHTGEKPYECSECKKRFNRANGLATHLKTHTIKKISRPTAAVT